jgi:hypothetical protein
MPQIAKASASCSCVSVHSKTPTKQFLIYLLCEKFNNIWQRNMEANEILIFRQVLTRLLIILVKGAP